MLERQLHLGKISRILDFSKVRYCSNISVFKFFLEILGFEFHFQKKNLTERIQQGIELLLITFMQDDNRR